MFEHLDDSEPFTPDHELLRTVVERGRRQRRWRRLGGSALSVVALAGVLGAGLLYVERRDAAIDRDEIATTPSVDGATNVLLVGSDEDNGLSGGRADTMAVVRVDADGAVRVLSIPRDLWNPDAGRRLNESLAGGPDQLIADVTSLTRIPIDHYVQMSFEGFSDLVDAAGGIELRIDTALRDRSSGLDVMSDPCARLDGEQALALLRSRHLELAAGATGGRWVVDGSGDLGRMARSRVVIDAALASLASTSIAELDRLSRVVADHAIVDDEMTLPGWSTSDERCATQQTSGSRAKPCPCTSPSSTARRCWSLLTVLPRPTSASGRPVPARAKPTPADVRRPRSAPRSPSPAADRREAQIRPRPSTVSRSSASSLTLASMRSREKSSMSRPWTIDHSPPWVVQGNEDSRPSGVP